VKTLDTAAAVDEHAIPPGHDHPKLAMTTFSVNFPGKTHVFSDSRDHLQSL
jgi:hypothetical protein